MKKKSGKRRRALLVVFMTFSLGASLLTACATEANPTTVSSVTGEDSKSENGVETENSSSAATGELTGDGKYLITGEANEEIVMDNHPISSYWFPSELLEWNAEGDQDVAYNKATVPLAERVSKDKLNPINGTQNKDTKVVAISIMNASTSGNFSHGKNRFDANTLTYWQYIDTLVYWGGSSGEGLIVPPSPDVTDAAHKNGVPVLGTVFFPQSAHGGKIQWLDDFLKKDEAGNFPMVDKLIQVANLYQFDGWFINQETEGTDAEPLSPQHAQLMQEFIQKFKAKAGDQLQIMWYDSMTKDGKMDWQNALTDENSMFLKDSQNQPVADSMFLNFWWTEDQLAAQELLKASNQKATAMGIDPYSLYAGVDVQADGIRTPIRWDLFENGVGKTFTSLGLYCPSWTYFSAETLDEYERNEKDLWVNSKGDPSAASDAEGTAWKGISTYVVEKTVVNKAPFVTNFSMGNGYSFFKDGVKISTMDWNNRSMMDVMPTYRWIIKNEGNNNLAASIDFAEAYYGGNSIKFRGSLEADKKSSVKLYSADLKLEDGITYTTTAKALGNTKLNLVLEMDDGTTETIVGDKTVGTEWTTVTYDISKLTGKTVKTISYEISSEAAQADFEMYLGRLSITRGVDQKNTQISNLKIDDVLYDDDNIYAGVRMSWEASAEETPAYYEVYRKNTDGTKSFYGVCNNPEFFINGFDRQGDEMTTELEVIPYDMTGKAGTSATTSMQWPDNSIPRAGFTASKTLIAPGEKVTFTNMSSQNTTELEWKFEGADIQTSKEQAPEVTYKDAGTYKVTLTAKNAKGEDTIEEAGLITVTEQAGNGLVNLSQGKSAEASSFVNDNEAPQFAVDGDVTKKWCATGTPPHQLTIDLGDMKTVSEVAIAHAEAGGEGADMNTQKYSIEVSQDGNEFTEVAFVKKNTAGNTVDTFKAVQARYIRLNIIKPTQGSDTAARIYEVEVRGLDGALN